MRTLTKVVAAVGFAVVVATVTANPAEAGIQACLNEASDQWSGCRVSNPGWYGDTFCSIAYGIDALACYPKEILGAIM